MFDGEGYRYVTAGDDLDAQKHSEGWRVSPSSGMIKFLIVTGLISANEVRRFKQAWRAAEMKVRILSRHKAPGARG